MHYTRLVLCALIALSFFPLHANAYFCWGPQKPREYLKDADLVFSGTVKEIQDLPATRMELNTPRQLVTFEIDKLWKGPDEITRLVGVDVESIYEYDFQENTKYLVFAYQIYSPRYTIVGCPRVRTAEEAKEDIAVLGTGYRTVSRVTSSVKFTGPRTKEEAAEEGEDITEIDEEELMEEEILEEDQPAPAEEQPEESQEEAIDEEPTQDTIDEEPTQDTDEEALEEEEELMEMDLPDEIDLELEEDTAPAKPQGPMVPTIPRVRR